MGLVDDCREEEAELLAELLADDTCRFPHITIDGHFLPALFPELIFASIMYRMGVAIGNLPWPVVQDFHEAAELADGNPDTLLQICKRWVTVL